MHEPNLNKNKKIKRNRNGWTGTTESVHKTGNIFCRTRTHRLPWNACSLSLSIPISWHFHQKSINNIQFNMHFIIKVYHEYMWKVLKIWMTKRWSEMHENHCMSHRVSLLKNSILPSTNDVEGSLKMDCNTTQKMKHSAAAAAAARVALQLTCTYTYVHLHLLLPRYLFAIINDSMCAKRSALWCLAFYHFHKIIYRYE